VPALAPPGPRLPRRAPHAHHPLRDGGRVHASHARHGKGRPLVSSILEALRELESQQPSSTAGALPPSEPPSRVNAGMETMGLAAIGLVIGALLFIGVTATWSFFPAMRSRVVALVPAPRATVATPAATHVAARPPAWLGAAEPPRARL